MKPLDMLNVFFIIAIFLVLMHDTQQDDYDLKAKTHKYYADSFQAAVDDAAIYLGRFEAQQTKSSIRYLKEKNIDLDKDVFNVFYNNLAMKFNIKGNAYELQNLMVHVPAMVLVQYNGYVLVTLDDTASSNGQHVLTPTFWPERPYSFTLNNGNTLFFTLDNNITMYDKYSNQFLSGDYASLAVQTNLAPLTSLSMFQEVRQKTITSLIENDMTAAINRHLELIKRMGLRIQITMPKGINELSIQNIGMLAFLLGYPLPDGEVLDLYSFGAGTVVERKPLIGTVDGAGKRVAYSSGCVPSSGITTIEEMFDSAEAAKKGYFVAKCP